MSDKKFKLGGGGGTNSDVYTDKNYVAKDRIWKDYIEKANYSARKWPENWGFLHGKLENVFLFQ